MGNHSGQHSQYLDSSLPVLLASSNMAKIEKLRVALEGVPRSIITPTDLGISIVIEEIGNKPIIAANGYISRDLFNVRDKESNFYMIG